MIIIPAIDLKEGRCVRLAQGDFGRMTVYDDDPVGVACAWKARGAERLHLVDLDGSLAGVPCHEAVIRDIVAGTGLPVQVGGGIRDMKTIGSYLWIGVRWVIIGTAALRDPGFVREACREFPGQVILGIDAVGGRVAVQGWTQTTEETAVALAKRFAEDRPDALVYTDIARDGMQVGVNIEGTEELAGSAGIPVIASGGVAGIRDIERLMPLEKRGVVGVIAGKALYTGALSLEEAIACTKGRRAS
ncbi:MAG: 1-(5-phosphoribosyl)-5-[(5-phosphoribosylamino)methylideneamino]imidazole-4-carboxamide isomerase [Pseudomonadota bacterium]|nr:1-(5-phosphoribosyl)-5-[(5-phosphoribosylamino)methylideneamino]imidazole-4-carboxamide isomerase [Pseudomonadota bacterium]MBU2234712.1 1-(5-phosphoribosyl)-5-[(5-phosphoribosylamino)methylideneamino]imidazole-4-carboxamide isomerase [Pseudomonadota bacterium]MBU3930960.1 1-(5-phosphoribosyl)-5-[(5-phosphoribosylamino)methylideneamino]imidazole-4-carboxamide isomerase [Pseudomonadota bacterium]